MHRHYIYFHPRTDTGSIKQQQAARLHFLHYLSAKQHSTTNPRIVVYNQNQNGTQQHNLHDNLVSPPPLYRMAHLLVLRVVVVCLDRFRESLSVY